jgi:hypothetical protein
MKKLRFWYWWWREELSYWLPTWWVKRDGYTQPHPLCNKVNTRSRRRVIMRALDDPRLNVCHNPDGVGGWYEDLAVPGMALTPFLRLVARERTARLLYRIEWRRKR